MTNLSPAAQAVLDAVKEICPAPADEIASTALRAAADQVVPKDDDPSEEWTTKDEIRYNLLAIAAELEGACDSSLSGTRGASCPLSHPVG